jgi:hypothetical protein
VRENSKNMKNCPEEGGPVDDICVNFGEQEISQNHENWAISIFEGGVSKSPKLFGKSYI